MHEEVHEAIKPVASRSSISDGEMGEGSDFSDLAPAIEPSTGEEVRLALARFEQSDLPLRVFQARRNFSILIHGENRIAHNLYALLLGSGFNRVRIIAASKSLSRHIEPADFNALSITRENLGEWRSETHLRIRRGADISFQSFQSQQEYSDQSMASYGEGQPDLIVSTSRSQGDYRQRWMSESTPHLYIDCGETDHGWLGPLVIPGRHPCLNCCDLHKRDLREKLNNEWVGDGGEARRPARLSTFRSMSTVGSGRSELPVAAAALIAATAALEISAYAASGRSPLIATRVPLSLRAPVDRGQSWNPRARADLIGSTPTSSTVDESTPQVRHSEHFDFHPECGCVGDLLSS